MALALLGAVGASGCVLDWNSFRPQDGGRRRGVTDAARDAVEPDEGVPGGEDAAEAGGMDVPGDRADVPPDRAMDAVPADTAPDAVDAGVDVPVDVPGEVGMDVPVATDTGCLPELRINELQAGSSGDAGASNEFVEIRNGAACEASLEGWTLRYASATGTTVSVRWTGTAADRIAAGGYAVVAGVGFPGMAIGRFGGPSGVLAGGGGAMGLFAPDDTRVDSVAYASATAANPLAEGTPAPNPPTGRSIARTPDGRDTDDNAADFQVATPTPNAAN